MPAPEKDPTWRAWVDGPPPLNQPPFLLLRLPSLPLPPLVLITAHEGEGREEGRGQSLQGPSARAPPEASGLQSATVPPLSSPPPSPLLIPYLTRLPSLSAAVVVAWSVGWFHYPLRAMHCRSFTAGLPTQFLHVSLSLVCLSVCLSRLSLSFVYFVVIRGREERSEAHPLPDLVSFSPLI